MGIFNTLFHKNNKNVQQAVNQAQPNGMYESNKLPSSCRHLEGNNISIQDVMPALTKKSSHSRSLSASTSTTASSGHSLKSLSRRSSTEKVPRFQVLSNGKHIHRLTQPPPQSKLTTSVNGFVNGVAKKTMKWTEKKHTVEDTTREHQMLLKRLDCDTDNHATFLENYGECQETVGKGTCGVVRLVRRMEDGTERVYAVKARRKTELLVFCLLIVFVYRNLQEDLMRNLIILSTESVWNSVSHVHSIIPILSRHLKSCLCIKHLPYSARSWSTQVPETCLTFSWSLPWKPMKPIAFSNSS